jgi:DeoR/GlpR family transcriptional regulator of sugar metabolism
VDPTTRRSLIQEAVDRDGFISLADLTDEVGVSRITVHRDLDYLAAIGAVERIRGGARTVNGPRQIIKTDFNLRRAQMAEAKAAIARRAVDEVKDGETIFLDSSTTALAFALELQEHELGGITLVTNSPAIGYQFQSPGVHLILVPGDVNQSLRAITGPWAIEFLRELHLSTAFVSAAAINATAGLMTTQKALAEMAKIIIARSDRRIALIDSSKFDGSALIQMAPLDSFDVVITDSGIDPDVLSRFHDAGVNVAVAGDEAPRTPGPAEPEA